MYFPDSIRARYGQMGATFRNVVHGSESRERAEKEIHFFFPGCENRFPLLALLSDTLETRSLRNSELLHGKRCCRTNKISATIEVNFCSFNNDIIETDARVVKSMCDALVLVILLLLSRGYLLQLWRRRPILLIRWHFSRTLFHIVS